MPPGGLRAAAYDGDVEEVRKLIAARANIEEKDEVSDRASCALMRLIPRRAYKSNFTNYVEHGVGGFVVEGWESTCTTFKTSTTPR